VPGGAHPLAAPEIPTRRNPAFPGLTYAIYTGLLAPARTPNPIIEQIAKASHALLFRVDYQKMLVDIGFDATPEIKS
jgi:hypothetical protein